MSTTVETTYTIKFSSEQWLALTRILFLAEAGNQGDAKDCLFAGALLDAMATIKAEWVF